ncbi:MAG: RNA polymerase sigma factor [Planctomycetota bacterium]
MTDWDAIVREHQGLVWSTVYRLVGDDADAQDCLQETFLEAVRVHRREPVREWPALLRRIATARALDRLRVRYRLRDRQAALEDPDVLEAGVSGPQQDAEAAELAELLRRSLMRLPVRQAEAFCLCRLEGQSYQEAADAMGVDASHVGVLLHRAGAALKKLLIAEGLETEESSEGRP